MELFIIISSIATFGIFWLALMNYKAYKKSEEKFNDLLQALITATLLSANTDPKQFDEFKSKFLSAYKGKTPIFLEK